MIGGKNARIPIVISSRAIRTQIILENLTSFVADGESLLHDWYVEHCVCQIFTKSNKNDINMKWGEI